ncbi:MAG: hypothetical protein R3Y23_00435 [Bacillota bacterium]
MSKKSKKAKQEALEAEEQAKLAAEAQAAPKSPKISFRVMNNCGVVPVARPADFIQLTPIVQPIPLVPYSTQEQPVAQFEDEEE